MKIENLNKETLWNDLRAKYPEAVDHFCKWVDEYKKEVGMNNWIDKTKGNILQTIPSIKFHELPFEMQTGILARYELECFYSGEKSQYKDYVETYKKALINAFSNRPKDKLKP